MVSVASVAVQVLGVGDGAGDGAGAGTCEGTGAGAGEGTGDGVEEQELASPLHLL